ncbi:MAG: protein-L-isoaspartate O-methyltransferase family protein [Halobacteriota archaeon]
MDPRVLREDMVDSLQYEAKDHVHTPELALAMREVPRHEFVDGNGAYEDVAHRHLGTTVLAPSTVAILLESLAPESTDSTLVVGSGVGYTAAVIAEMTDPRLVHAVDIDRRLVAEARSNLARAGYPEVLVDCRDGAGGLPEYAPFDRILVEAGAVRPPRRLLDQLAQDGRLVIPLGTAPQTLAAVATDGQVDAGPTVQFKPMLVNGEQSTAIERNRMDREERERAVQASMARTGWEHEWIDW